MKILRKTFAGLPAIQFSEANHTPHWKRSGNRGWLDAQMHGHPAKKWVEFDVTEASVNERNKHTTKRVMFCLDENAVRELHAFLGEILAKDERDAVA